MATDTQEVAELRIRLAEAEAVLAALREGHADALVTAHGTVGLTGSERPYRAFFDAMNEGGLTLDERGRILHCNPQFSGMVGRSIGRLRGSRFIEYVIPEFRDKVRALLGGEVEGSCEAALDDHGGRRRPVQLSARSARFDSLRLIYLVVTDLSERVNARTLLRQSTDRFASLYEAMTEGVALHELIFAASGEPVDYLLLDVNPAFEAITALDRRSVIGRLASEVYGTSPPPFLDRYVSVTISGRPMHFETTFEPMAKSFSVSVFSPTENRFATVFTDISERKRTEEALQSSKDRIKLALFAARAGTWEWDLKTNENVWSDELWALYGLMPEQYKPSYGTWLEAIHPEDRDRVAASVIKSSAQGEVLNLEWRVNTSDGAERWLMSRGQPEFDGEGQVARYLGVVIDVTEQRLAKIELDRHRHHLEELVAARTSELMTAKNAAEAANRAKSTFLSNMSHEIRTPMNAIVGMASVLRRSGITPLQADRLDKIETASDHLLRVINDILDLSKIEAGKFLIDDARLSISSLLANISSIMAPRAQAKGLELRVDSDTFPDDLHGDSTRLQQAVLNYVTNAIKFTEAGSITLRAINQDETSAWVRVRFEVEDSGVGVPPDALPRLFSAFEQVDNSSTRHYGGTGLGLVITRRLAELMGGEAGANSTPGVGSTFWFTVRLAKRERRETLTPAATIDAEMSLRQRHQGQRILLVDDEPFNLEVARFLLEGSGLVVDTDEDGIEAVERAGKANYTAILMDMQMPRLDGLEATRQIREFPGYRDTPIVAMTANAFIEDKTRCLAAGMNDFLSKPFDPEQLFSMLLKHLDQ